MGIFLQFYLFNYLFAFTSYFQLAAASESPSAPTLKTAGLV